MGFGSVTLDAAKACVLSTGMQSLEVRMIGVSKDSGLVRM